MSSSDRVENLSKMVLLSNPSMSPEDATRKATGLIDELDKEKENHIESKEEKTRRKNRELINRTHKAQERYKEVLLTDKDYVAIEGHMDDLIKEAGDLSRSASVEEIKFRITQARDDMINSQEAIRKTIADEYDVNIFNISSCFFGDAVSMANDFLDVLDEEGRIGDAIAIRKQKEEQQRVYKAQEEYRHVLSTDKNQNDFKKRMDRISRKIDKAPEGKNVEELRNELISLSHEYHDARIDIGEEIAKKHGVNYFEMTSYLDFSKKY